MSNSFFFKIKDLQIKPSNQKEWLDFLEKHDGKEVSGSFERETGVRTPKQSDSLHLFFDHLASALNAAGLDMRKVLKEHVMIEWTKENVKEYIWRPLQKALTGKESTKDLDKVSDINLIYDNLNRHFGEKYEIHVPFPSEDTKQKSGIPYPKENNKTEF